MDNLNESLKEAVCIEEQVFFGPITDKEKQLKEQFENAFKNENKLAESRLNVDNDISRNDSLYKSFSATESKYDSFDDSLNEELQQSQETKHIKLRKSFDKLKSKKHGFYDSLEDVCSLVSNMDKCSISCEVEDPSNLNDKQHIIEDSLKNPSAAVVNKSSGVNEQIHFDEDSLAILELENTFDDSLEEINDVCVQSIESFEFEEMEDIEKMTVENQNIAIKVEQNPVCITRNLFDTSVQILYEKKWVNDQDSSSDDKNMLYDSLSNSDLKDILKDSLEESEKCSPNLKFLKPSLGATNADIQKAERMFASQENVVDASVLIVHESFQNDCQVRNDCEMKNLEINEFSKDGLESFKNVNKEPVRQIIKTVNENDSLFSSTFCNENAASKKCPENASANASDKATHPDSNINQDNELMEGISIITDPVIPVSAIGNSSQKEPFIVDSCQLKLLNDNTTTQKVPKNISINLSENTVYPDSNANQDEKLMKGTSVVSDPVYAIVNSNLKGACGIDSCQLKLSNDNMDIDKDLKPQMNVDATVEDDKKCQVFQDVQVLPEIGVQSKEYEPDLSGENSKEYHSEDHTNEKEVLDINNSKECNPIEDIVCDEVTSNKNVCENSKIMNAIITHRTKSCGSQLISDLEGNFNFPEDLSNVSLLQALDLHDISESFLFDSFIQSNNSLMPLNLCCKDQDVCNTPICRDESKENVPQSLPTKKKQFSTSSKKASPAGISKTPKPFQNSPSFKDSCKKTPGTKIPVRKIENFIVPVATPNKSVKQVATAMSAEKVRKCHPLSHSAGKKTPGTTPNKTPHFCKVRNTIFSKVPQIVPSKKYINIQSPVAQYIKNVNGSVKTPRFDPVLRDCMNPRVDSPFHSHQTPKGGTLKSTMKKT